MTLTGTMRRIFKIQNCSTKNSLFEPDKTKLRLIAGEWIGPEMNHYLSEFIMGYDDLTEIIDGELVWKYPDEGITWTGGWGGSRLLCVRCNRDLTDEEVNITYVSEYYNVRSYGSAKCANCKRKFHWNYTGTS